MPRLRYSAASKEDLKEIARLIAKDKLGWGRQLWLSGERVAAIHLGSTQPKLGNFFYANKTDPQIRIGRRRRGLDHSA